MKKSGLEAEGGRGARGGVLHFEKEKNCYATVLFILLRQMPMIGCNTNRINDIEMKHSW